MPEINGPFEKANQNMAVESLHDAGRGKTPFLSLHDPADLARAYAALEAVWNEVKQSLPDAIHETERAKIAAIVADCAPLALDEDDLARNVRLQYRSLADVCSRLRP